MAYGTELALAVDLGTAHVIVEREAPGVLGDATDQLAWDDAVHATNEALAPRLLDAHRQLLAGRFGHAETASTASGDIPLLLTTVAGAPRQVWPFTLQVIGDDGELGHSWPGMYRVGVPLVTRYWPSWLDVDQPHGGSGMPVVLDGPTLALVDDARQALAAVVPELAAAVLVVAPKWY